MTAEADLHTAVRQWIADDPDPETAAELRATLEASLAGDAQAGAALERWFQGMLQFGTAGLRGELGGGPARMNRAVVIRAAAGLARYVADRLGAEAPGGRPDPTQPGRVVVGYDARRKSAEFALDSAAVFAGAGLEALLLPGPLPTPVLAHAVLELGADAGVMVTASHNPPRDNGYKVYLGGRLTDDDGRGAQIVSPADAEIAARIAQVPSVASVPRPSAGWTVLGGEVADGYVERAAALVPAPLGGVADERAGLRVVLTAMHGVGAATAEAVLAAAGFTDVRPVPEQREPDPAFPTVAFPNPEEPGAMDLALALARESGADLALALDPDADRLAVAIEADGRWAMLSGDRVGCLLGDWLGAAHADGGAGSVAGGVLASSIVSTQMLARIAARHGLGYRSTLTGFKWLSRVPGLVFGYEEALGYCVAPGLARDKDGISAAVVVAARVAALKARGVTVADEIDRLDREYGVHLTRQVSARFDSAAEAAARVADVVAGPPAALGGSPVARVEDLAVGVDGLGPTAGLRLFTESGARVVLRPSGTEPKAKAYLEAVEAPGGDVAASRARALAVLDGLEADVRGMLGAT